MAYRGEERRTFLRTSHTYTISFKRRNEPDVDWDISNTKNLSLGGALFLSSESFLPNSLLDIRLNIPTQHDYCHCQAKVQRCKGQLNNAFYTTAVYFTKIDARYIEPLKKSIDFFLSKHKKA